ncbi:MAG: integrase arm-type DNA-binding domain-containing protein [Myxococcota bacterium]
MPLADKASKALKPGRKARNVAEDGRLFLLVNPDAALSWRLKYRVGGSEKLISLGVYSQTELALAREKREEARSQLAAGIDPSAARKAEKVARADSFEAVALEWIAKETPGWAPAHAKRVKARLKRDAFPCLASMPVGSITPGDVLEVVRRVANAGHVETAHRLLWGIDQTMRFAVPTGRASGDPTPALRGALPAARREHFAAIIEPDSLGELLRMMEWSELDLDAKGGALWTIPGDEMKGGRGSPRPALDAGGGDSPCAGATHARGLAPSRSRRKAVPVSNNIDNDASGSGLIAIASAITYPSAVSVRLIVRSPPACGNAACRTRNGMSAEPSFSVGGPVAGIC